MLVICYKTLQTKLKHTCRDKTNITKITWDVKDRRNRGHINKCKS